MEPNLQSPVRWTGEASRAKLLICRTGIIPLSNVLSLLGNSPCTIHIQVSKDLAFDFAKRAGYVNAPIPIGCQLMAFLARAELSRQNGGDFRSSEANQTEKAGQATKAQAR